MAERETWLGRRLTTILLVVSGCVLLASTGGISVYEYYIHRQEILRHLKAVAAIVSTNTTAALAFEDRREARELLAGLRAEPGVEEAALYDRRGNLFAAFTRRDSAVLPPVPERDGFRFVSAGLVGFHPVAENGMRLGTLYIRADIMAWRDRIRDYAAVAGAVAVAAFLLAYVLSRRLQRQISTPILALADTARAVSERRDYSVRARSAGRGELGELTLAFNHMLNRIQGQMGHLELLNRVTRAIGQRLELEGVFQALLANLEENMPADFACICLYQPFADRFLVSSLGPRSEARAAELQLPLGAVIAADENGLAQCVRGELACEPDLTYSRFPLPRRLADKGLLSMVASPLILEGNVFGILIIARREVSAFSPQDCDFLRQVSEQAALAVQQARLYEALKRAYEDLRQSQQAILQQERLRALGQMASGIAHDINNAISPISLYAAYLLENERDLSPRTREYLEVISHAAEDVAATVARMREFYRQREPQTDLAPVQLNRALQQVVDLTRVRWSDMFLKRGNVIRIQTDLAEDLPEIRGVEGEIREALTNLFLNAFDAMPEGGTLTLRTHRAEDGQIVLEVIDTGIGMDEDTQKRALEPFFTTKGERGTGLGLAMVYGVAQRHGAKVEIESMPGEGTTVRLLFPASSAPSGSPSSPASAPPPGLRILVVDDDPALLKSLAETLRSDGHFVAAAGGGQAGIEAFRAAARSPKGKFDVVITDLGMPYVDGRKVALKVKEASPQTPVILLTGWGQRSSLEDEAYPPAVDKVLDKPPTPAQLREALANILAGAGTNARPLAG